jgi:NAD(P) transhydrogenase beta subunit
MYVNVAILKETHPHERRVALTPSVAPKLIKLGAKLHMQTGAADGIRLSEAAFENVVFIANRKDLVSDADLQSAGVIVKFAIHPVAGRMPGQMDVLLAEAGVPYDLIFQLEDINDEFANADVALVIGANDVVNPAARSDKSSPIFGMPILNADKAKQVYVVKRGQGKGYAGIVNALFYADNCNMVYGDAAAVLTRMIEAVRGLGSKAAA